jgi:hypothetical protein
LLVDEEYVAGQLQSHTCSHAFSFRFAEQNLPPALQQAAAELEKHRLEDALTYALSHH